MKRSQGGAVLAVQKRNNEYYLQRLKKDWPLLYRAVRAGKITVAEARRQAGLGGHRTRLHELKNAWDKATPTERSGFLAWAGLGAMSASPATRPGSVLPPPPTAWDSDGRMLAWAKRRIPEIMARRRMTAIEVADELGMNRLDQSIAMAMQRDWMVKSPATAAAVDRWLAANASV
jgi:hypothetical protein